MQKKRRLLILIMLSGILVVGSWQTQQTYCQNESNNTSGIIVEGSDEFAEGIMDNLTLNDDGYLSLKKKLVRSWSQQTPSSTPGMRYWHSMVYDSNFHKVILFGGHDGSFTLLNDTWVYDLGANTWVQQNPLLAPSARKGHSMVYDSSSSQVILFGGNGHASGLCDDTWTYDLRADSWTQQTPSSSPSIRQDHSMVYDSSSDRVILFGGNDVTSLFDDTWIYDLTTNTWTEMNPSTKPSARSQHSMVYDSSSGRVILFGGILLDETWTYELTTNNWTQQHPSSSPSVRHDQSMVYDSSSDRVILFGGYDGANLGDTWIYDPTINTWTQQTPSSSPSARFDSSMVYDSSSDRVILFGGMGFRGVNDETWVYSLSEHHYKGTFESKLTYFGDIYNITGGFTWNPITQPVGTELKFQIGFSNTTKEEDFYYTDSYTSDFSFTGFGQYLKYRVTFQSDDKHYLSPLVKSIYIYYSLEKPVPSIPSIPLNLLTTVGGSFIELSWTPPSSDGGSTITHYNVYRGTTTGEYMFLGISTVTSFTDSLVLGGTTYYYVVTAINAIGESVFSTEVNVVPSRTTTTVPGVPQDLSAVSGDNFVSLSWSPPDDDGGSAITRYNVYRGTSTGEYMFIGISTVTSFNDTLVLGDITYYYVVTAINAIGESAFSSEVSATPTGATIPKSGPFPSFLFVLLFLGALIVVTRKTRKS